ncbi:MAG: NAD-dependent epimerase/dehydratase family protein [Paludibacter sp.]
MYLLRGGKMLKNESKIIVTGAAGLVGQNLIVMLKEQGYKNITALDKHQNNSAVLKRIHPDIDVFVADLAEHGDWEKSFTGGEVLIILHAQITAKDAEPFVRNNEQATKIVLEAARKSNIPYIVHISSSVVISMADDDYTNTKKAQEDLVRKSRFKHCILRPPLMFGWFDKKHLGWLSRFMERIPAYPIPGNGNYLRQPLYVRDLCSVIIKCMEEQPENKVYNIIGKECIDYIDIIRTIKRVKKLNTLIINIPYSLFDFLLKTYALFSSNPPFTSDQLKALTAGDYFPVDNWWDEFNINYTPFEQAMIETHCDQRYNQYILEP